MGRVHRLLVLAIGLALLARVIADSKSEASEPSRDDGGSRGEGEGRSESNSPGASQGEHSASTGGGDEDSPKSSQQENRESRTHEESQGPGEESNVSEDRNSEGSHKQQEDGSPEHENSEGDSPSQRDGSQNSGTRNSGSRNSGSPDGQSQENPEESSPGESRGTQSEQSGSKEKTDETAEKTPEKNQQKSLDNELLSLVEFEFFQMTPMMFTLKGQSFVESINDLLELQIVNSSVIGVLMSGETDEPAVLVATIILSHFNDSTLYQLGDIQSYLASYLANHQDKMSLRASRVTPIHSRKVSSLASDAADKTNKGWVFFAGNSASGDKQSRYSGKHGQLMFRKVEYKMGHTHSYANNNDKRSLMMGKRNSMVGREVAELDDDVIEWKNFKLFHMRSANMDGVGGDGWNVMMWNERSLQDSAQNTKSSGGKASMSAGAIAGTVLSVLAVAVVASGLVAYGMYRRNKKQSEGSSLHRRGSLRIGTDEEQRILV